MKILQHQQSSSYQCTKLNWKVDERHLTNFKNIYANTYSKSIPQIEGLKSKLGKERRREEDGRGLSGACLGGCLCWWGAVTGMDVVDGALISKMSWALKRAWMWWFGICRWLSNKHASFSPLSFCLVYELLQPEYLFFGVISWFWLLDWVSGLNLGLGCMHLGLI